MKFTNDELILALVSVVRVVNPRMLESGPDGFTVNLAPLEKKTPLTADEQLLVKLYSVLVAEAPDGLFEVEFLADDTQRLLDTLAQLERMREWPEDALNMCRDVRQRLQGETE